MLGHFLVRDSGRSVNDPLRAYQRRAAEKPDKLHCPDRVVCPDNPLAGGKGRSERVVVEPQAPGPRELDDGSGTGVKSHIPSLPSTVKRELAANDPKTEV